MKNGWIARTSPASFFQRKITVVEPLIDRILDDLVIAAIFAVVRKGRRPVRAAFKLSP